MQTSSITLEDPVLNSAGLALRRLRHGNGLTTRDVEAASAAIARKHRNHKYQVPISRLCQFEAGCTTPSIYRLYSLAIIYHQNLEQLLQWYGIGASNPISEPESGSSVVSQSDHSLCAVDAFVGREHAFDPRKTSYLGQIAGRVREAFSIEQLERFANHESSYGYIGADDWTMNPLLPPATVVQIDESRNRISAGGWTSEYERPIYFLEMRGKYVCCWCTSRREAIILTPHPLSPVPPQVLQHHDAEVLGQVVGAVLMLGRKRPLRT